MNDRLKEDPAVQRIAAESLVESEGLSIEAANAALQLQDASMGVLDEIEDELGEDLGGIWFEHGGPGINIAFAHTTSPPSGPNVEAVTRILSAHDLLGHAEFVSVRWSRTELHAGAKRAWQVLKPLAQVTNVMALIDEKTNSIEIEIADDLTDEQSAIVEEAVAAAKVSVRIDPCLKGPDPNLPPVEMVWTVVSVGQDLRSLLVSYSPGPHRAGESTITLRETQEEIWIGIEVPDIGSFPGMIVPAIAVLRKETVRLANPIAGRRIAGSEGSPSWSHASYGSASTPDGWGLAVVPRVLGLTPADAHHLLRAQQFEPRQTAGAGREIVAQDPAPDTAVEPGSPVTITAGASQQRERQ